MWRFVSAVVLSLATMAPSFGAAQSFLPAEFPPADFEGNQYVDSNGCAFIRAGISGVTNWVPRMNRAREPLCGFQPTFASATPQPEPQPAPEPVIAEADPEPAPAPIQIPAPAQVAEAPAPRPAASAAPSAGASIESVASIATPPSIDPAPEAAPAEPEVRSITLAEACEGRTGIQPRFINSRTGQPIDCGPGAEDAAIPANMPISIPRIASPAEDDGVLRLTLAEICARSAAEGTRFVNAQTGAPISCPTAPTVIAGPVAPSAPSLPSIPAAPTIDAPVVAPVVASVPRTGCSSPYLTSSDRADVRCGPQAQSPSGYNSAVAAPTHSVARSPAGHAVAAGVPVSNPVAAPVPAAPAPGYVPIWDDGRVNPQRGLTATAAPAPQVQAPTAYVSTRNVPQSTGHRYVQIGTYGDPANAERAAARLRSLGLPVGFANITRNGQALRVVAAGPFADAAALGAALNAARAAGYGDAFTRR